MEREEIRRLEVERLRQIQEDQQRLEEERRRQQEQIRLQSKGGKEGGEIMRDRNRV